MNVNRLKDFLKFRLSHRSWKKIFSPKGLTSLKISHMKPSNLILYKLFAMIAKNIKNNGNTRNLFQFLTIFLTHCFDQAHNWNRTTATDNRTMEIKNIQLLSFSRCVMYYNCAQFHCFSVFSFGIGEEGGGGGGGGGCVKMSCPL